MSLKTTRLQGKNAASAEPSSRTKTSTVWPARVLGPWGADEPNSVERVVPEAKWHLGSAD